MLQSSKLSYAGSSPAERAKIILLLQIFIKNKGKKMTKEKLLSMIGEFTYCWGFHFFIETSEGNFVWEDPDYGGNNTIKKFNGSLSDFLAQFNGIDFGRDKGKHYIWNYCGKDFVLIAE